jgi:hypothetical protein
MYISVHVKYLLFFQIVIKLEFYLQIVQQILISNFMKIRRLGAEFFYVDRQTDGLTDMTKLKIAFSNYTNAPNVQPFNAI